MLECGALDALQPTWGQEVAVKMQCVLDDRTAVEKDRNLVFIIGEGDVNQVKPFMSLQYGAPKVQHTSKIENRQKAT